MVGGIELGFERTGGFETRWLCEIEPYPRAVLRKHWPKIPCYGDVKSLCVTEHPEPVDLICGGFPCQDISGAGKKAGIIEGKRSSLFFQAIRVVRALRPKYVLLENVAALTIRGLDTVLGEMALCGYDAEWDSISAASVGANHRRDRLFIFGYDPDAVGCAWEHQAESALQEGQDTDTDGIGDVPDPASDGRADRYLKDFTRGTGEAVASRGPQLLAQENDGNAIEGRGVGAVADPASIVRSWSGQEQRGAGQSEAPASGRDCDLSDPARLGRRGGHVRGRRVAPDVGPFERARLDNRIGAFRDASRWWWATEPAVGRVAHGVPSRVDRLRCLGNAVVPTVAEYIGQCILDWHSEHTLSSLIALSN